MSKSNEPGLEKVVDKLAVQPEPIRSQNRDEALKAIINLCGEYKVNLEFIDRLNHILDGWETYTKGMLHRHIDQTCPVCHEIVGNPSLADVCYFFDICDCNQENYSHLGERLAHRHCVVDTSPDQLPQEFLDSNLPELPHAMFMGIESEKFTRRDLMAIVGWHRRQLKEAKKWHKHVIDEVEAGRMQRNG